MSKVEQPTSWPSLEDPVGDKTPENDEVIEEPDLVVVEHEDVNSADTTAVAVDVT